jgi:GTP-binding protein YchF
MRSGIIGLPGAGKSTIFEALTHNFSASDNRGEDRIGTVTVPDPRVDALSGMYQPRKTIYAQVEYFLPGLGGAAKDKGRESSRWTPVRDCDALIHVVRNFSGYGFDPPSPAKDFETIDQELNVSDFVVAEKRLERLALDQKRGKGIDTEESALLKACVEHLESGNPLRRFPEMAGAQQLKGYAFLSAKPMMVLLNNEDDDEALPDLGNLTTREACLVLRGKLEQELAQMSEAEAREFLAEFNISASAMDRIIKKSYELLGLISFFTVGEDEVRAWTIKKNTRAVDAAEVIHSDMKKGFIRAEVVHYDALMSAGSYAEARKMGIVRLEGKDYEVQDGEIFHVRFNV